MKLLDNQSVKVGDKNFPIRVSVRAMIEYEKLTGKPITSFEGTEDLIRFFYVTAKAGAKAEGNPFSYTYEQFIDLIDDYYADAITNFSKVIYEGGEQKKTPGSSE